VHYFVGRRINELQNNRMNTNSQWYVAQGEHYLGPMEVAEVLRRVQSGEFSFVHYAWKQGMTDWKRICDLDDFKVSAPPPPPKKPELQSPPSPPKKAQVKEWFLYTQEVQSGPFTEDEVKGLAASAKIDANDSYLWKEGMSEWAHYSEVEGFKSRLVSAAPVASAGTHEKRQSPRKTMVAQIHLANSTEVITGVCRDVSIGGMQILCDKIPGAIGSKIKLNVSPLAGTKDFNPFVAEGVIVRILENHRGFSFRFNQLGSEATQIIQKFLG
jgi:hypothetical protein